MYVNQIVNPKDLELIQLQVNMWQISPAIEETFFGVLLQAPKTQLQ